MLPPEFQLFILFGRFEYALKRGGFLRGAIGSNAEANWDSFAKHLGRSFFDEHKKNEHNDPDLAELFSLPPRKGIVERLEQPDGWVGQFGWKDMPVPQNVAELFGAIRRIRNNLFHGDKTNPDWPRNAILVRAALTVLANARARASDIASLQRVASYL